MPAHTALKDQLSKSSEITITVTGRKTGRKTSRPVWFVLEGSTLYLVPVEGSDTRWYKNVLKNPVIGIASRGTDIETKATTLTDTKQVSSVVDKFRAKYGPADVKKYYSKFDAAVSAKIS